MSRRMLIHVFVELGHFASCTRSYLGERKQATLGLTSNSRSSHGDSTWRLYLL
jgi:hypothetical protein